jgi:hypothetical protein
MTEFIPDCCDTCKYCKIQFVKKYWETYWKCKVMKYKDCYDETIENFSVYEHIPTWCPQIKT